MQRPLFIALEGIDGSGKGTQAARLTALLNAWTLHFPNYATPTGQLVLQMLQGKSTIVKVTDEYAAWYEGNGVDFYNGLEHAYTFQSLALSNRMETVPEMLETLNTRSIVLDRYHVSGMVYGASDDLPTDWLTAIHGTLPKPDLTFLLDIDVDDSFIRRPERQDVYEKNRDRLENVNLRYRDFFKSPPITPTWRGDTIARYCTVDGRQHPDRVFQILLDHINSLNYALFNKELG